MNCPPDIIVEVISPSSTMYDRMEKLELYESQGVPEYWGADPILLSLQSRVVPTLVGDPAFLFAGLPLPSKG